MRDATREKPVPAEPLDEGDESQGAGATKPAVQAEKTLLRRRRAALITAVLLALFAAVMLPIAVASVIVEFVLPPEAEVVFLTEPPPPRRPAGEHVNAAYLNIAVVAIDEARGRATLLVSGHRSCGATCEPMRIVLFSLSDIVGQRVGLPPSASITIAPSADQVSESIELPVRGQPSQYPVDRYNLVLGVVVETVDADGTAKPVHPEDRDVRAYLSLQSQVQRLVALPPKVIDPVTVHSGTDPYAYLYVRALEFRRPAYLPVLAVLLVTFIAAAAVYSARTQPVNQLLLGVGSLVLGVWGIRSILVPGSPPYITAVDLALSLVILILLGGIIGRGLLHVYRGRNNGPGQ
jgi:hypothetical protein